MSTNKIISGSLKRYNSVLIKNHTEALSTCVTRFSNTCVEFVDAILSVLPKETQLVLIKIYIKTRISQDKLLRKFIKRIVPVKEFIVNRNEDFFMNNQYLDSLFDESSVVSLDFRAIWSKLNSDNKNSVWDWFTVLLGIADEYVKTEKILKGYQTRFATPRENTA